MLRCPVCYGDSGAELGHEEVTAIAQRRVYTSSPSGVRGSAREKKLIDSKLVYVQSVRDKSTLQGACSPKRRAFTSWGVNFFILTYSLLLAQRVQMISQEKKTEERGLAIEMQRRTSPTCTLRGGMSLFVYPRTTLEE